VATGSGAIDLTGLTFVNSFTGFGLLDPSLGGMIIGSGVEDDYFGGINVWTSEFWERGPDHCQ
jgi:hypothetical protein